MTTFCTVWYLILTWKTQITQWFEKQGCLCGMSERPCVRTDSCTHPAGRWGCPHGSTNLLKLLTFSFFCALQRFPQLQVKSLFCLAASFKGTLVCSWFSLMLVMSLSFQKMHMEFGSQERTVTFIVVDIWELLFKRTKVSLNHQAWYLVTHPVPHLPLVLCSVIHACSHCQRPPGQRGIPANWLPLSSKGLENKEEG